MDALDELVVEILTTSKYPDHPTPKNPRRIDFNLVEMEALFAQAATHQEVAEYFGVSRSTVTRRLREERYRYAWDKGRSRLCLALRKKQIEVAMSGNVNMLIWLGKQYLGQSDDPVPVEENWDPERAVIDLDDFEDGIDEMIAEVEEEERQRAEQEAAPQARAVAC